MKNKQILAVLAAGVIGAWGILAPASAQNTANSQLLGSGVMSKFSASDVTSMMGEFGIVAALSAYDGSETAMMIAATSGGARFIVSLMACDDLATATGCKQALVFTALPNAGFAYEDLNQFNLGADVTKAVNFSEQNILLFSAPIYAGGGIGRGNFKLLAALFLNDMQKFADAQANSAAEVSFDQGPRPVGKLENFGSNSETAPRDMAPYSASMTGHALSAAVANTWKAEFLTPEAEAALK